MRQGLPSVHPARRSISLVLLLGLVTWLLWDGSVGHASTVLINNTYMSANQDDPPPKPKAPPLQAPAGTTTVYFHYSVITPGSDSVDVKVFASGPGGALVIDSPLYANTSGSPTVGLSPASGLWDKGGYCTVLYIDGSPSTSNPPIPWSVGPASPPACPATADWSTATAAPSSTATAVPTATPIPTPTSADTTLQAITPTDTPVPTATPLRTSTAVPTATQGPTNTPVPTVAGRLQATSAPQPTQIPTWTPTVTTTPTVTPTSTSTPVPTLSTTVTDTPVPTKTPSATATASPTSYATWTPVPTVNTFVLPPATPTNSPLPTNTPVPTAVEVRTSSGGTTSRAPKRMDIAVLGGLRLHASSTLPVFVHGTRGHPVVGVLVLVDGRPVGMPYILGAETNRYGVTTFRSIRPSHAGVVTIRASKRGYRTATARLSVVR